METRSSQFLAEHGNGTVTDPRYVGSLVAKWGKALEGIRDPHKRAVTAVLFENQLQHVKSLNEETLSTGVGSFTKYIFPILRRVFPNLIANEIMSVQPMSAPTGAVFFYESKYANTKGGITAGDNLIETFNKNYTAEYIEEESIGVGTGVLVTFSTNLDWTPVRALDADFGFEVTVSDGVEDFVDDGAGVLTGDAGGTGTINYTTGLISVTFNAAPLNLVPVVATYYYNGESNASVPEVNVSLTMTEIRAQSRRLKVVWSAEAAEDLRNLHGVDMEQELVATSANQMALEIDRELIGMLLDEATTSPQTYTYAPTAGTFANELDSIRNMITKISSIASKIHKASGRAPANFIVAPPEVVSLLDQLTTHGDYRPVFQSDPSASYGPLDAGQAPGYGPLTANFGVTRVGTLMNKFAVYCDPLLDASASSKRCLIGLKGQSYLDAGAVYAPYIPIQATGTFLDPDDQTYKKGLRTRYAKKVLRPEFYGVLTVAGLPS